MTAHLNTRVASPPNRARLWGRIGLAARWSPKRPLAALLLSALALSAHATQYTVNGKVAKVYSLDRTTYGSPVDHFTIEGFTQAGNCLTNDDLVAMVLRDDEGGRRQLAVVLMARAMGWTLHVRVNDSIATAGGTCLLQVLEVER